MMYFFIKNKKLLFFVIFYNYFITDNDINNNLDNIFSSEKIISNSKELSQVYTKTEDKQFIDKNLILDNLKNDDDSTNQHNDSIDEINNNNTDQQKIEDDRENNTKIKDKQQKQNLLKNQLKNLYKYKNINNIFFVIIVALFFCLIYLVNINNKMQKKLQFNTTTLQNQNNQLTNQTKFINTNEKLIKDKEQEIENLKQNLERLTNTFNEKEKELLATNLRENSKKTTEIQQFYQKEIETQKQLIKELKQQINKETIEKDKIKALEEELNKLKNINKNNNIPKIVETKTTDQIRNDIREEFEKQNNDLFALQQQTIEKLEKTNRVLQSNANQNNEIIIEKNTEIRTINQLLDSLTEEQSKINAENKELEEKIKELNNTIEIQNSIIVESSEANNINSLASKKKSLTDKINELEQIITNLEITTKDLEKEYKSHSSKYEQAKDEYNRHEKFIQSANKNLKILNAQNNQLTEQIQEKKDVLNSIQKNQEKNAEEKENNNKIFQQLNQNKQNLLQLSIELNQVYQQFEGIQSLKDKNCNESNQAMILEKRQLKIEQLLLNNKFLKQEALKREKEQIDQTKKNIIENVFSNIEDLYKIYQFRINPKDLITENIIIKTINIDIIQKIYNDFSIFNENELFLFSTSFKEKIFNIINDNLKTNPVNFNEKNIIEIFEHILKFFDSVSINITDNLSLKNQNKKGIFNIYIWNYLYLIKEQFEDNIQKFLEAIDTKNQQKIDFFNELFLYGKMYHDVLKGVDDFKAIQNYIEIRLQRDPLKNHDNFEINDQYEVIINLLKKNKYVETCIELTKTNEKLKTELFNFFSESVVEDNLEPQQKQQRHMQGQSIKMNNIAQNKKSNIKEFMYAQLIFKTEDNIAKKIQHTFNINPSFLHDLFKQINEFTKEIYNYIYIRNHNNKIIDLLNNQLSFNLDDLKDNISSISSDKYNNSFDIIKFFIKDEKQEKYIKIIEYFNRYYIGADILFIDKNQVNEDNILFDFFKNMIDKLETLRNNNKNNFSVVVNEYIKKVESIQLKI